MKSVSHLKIQPRNFPFPLWSHRMSVPPWCTLCWNDSLSNCHVWDPSPHLSLARSTGTWLTPHTHAHPALRHTAVRFLPFPPPLGGFDIYLFLCMCHTRQSKADSGGFKLLRKEQISFLLSHGSAEHRVSFPFGQVLSSRAACPRAVLGTQLRQQSQPARSKESPKGRTTLLPVLCPLILFNWKSSPWQFQHSNSSPIRRRVSAFLFQCNMLTAAHS